MLKKKNIIVTGSSRGLGLAIAKELIAQNHKVVLNGRNQQPFLKLKQRNKNDEVEINISNIVNEVRKKIVKQ